MQTAEWNKVVQLVRPKGTERAKQDIDAFFGINEVSTETRGLSMLVTMFGPGENSNAHMHLDSETGLYCVSGDAHFVYGEHLEHDVIMTQGDFLYIPPFCPHKGYNRRHSESVVFVTARTDAHEQERVVVTPEADDGSSQDRVEYLD